MNESFLFFRSYYEAGKQLPPRRQLAFYNAILTRIFEGKPLPTTGHDAALFALVAPSIEKSAKVSASGRKGGSAATEAKKTTARENGKFGGRPLKNPSETQASENENPTTKTKTKTETKTETRAEVVDDSALAGGSRTPAHDEPNVAPDDAAGGPGAVPAMADTEVAPPALRDVLRVCSNDGCTNPGGVTIPEAFGRYFFGQMQNMGWTQTNGLRVTRRNLRSVLFKWWQHATDDEKARILGAADASGEESEELRRIRERARERERRIAQLMGKAKEAHG